MEIKIVNKSPHQLPEYKTEGSSGMDIRAYIKEGEITLNPHEVALIPTGLYVSIPQGYEIQIRGRSGLALKHGVGLANGIGTIDSDYRGEIGVILMNFSNTPFVVKDGERIAQTVCCKYESVEWRKVDSLDETLRGEGGFGHTGR